MRTTPASTVSPPEGTPFRTLLVEALRRAYPAERVVGYRQSDFLASVFAGEVHVAPRLEKAMNEIALHPRANPAALYTVPDVVASYVTTRFVREAMPLADARVHEQTAQSALDPLQMRPISALTVGDLHRERELAYRQIEAARVYHAALCREIADREEAERAARAQLSRHHWA